MPPRFAIPELEEFLVWHSRNDAEPGHRWFRSLLLESSMRFREVPEEQRRFRAAACQGALAATKKGRALLPAPNPVAV